MNEDIRKVVYEQLATICDNVYYEDVPHASLLPYIVFSFPSNGRMYRNQVVSDMQVDIYDVDRDGYNVSVGIDRTVMEVERLFDYRSFSEGETSFWFKIRTRTAIPFPNDVNIWARQLVFETKIYRSDIC
jgi:hypothetical protein